MSTTLTLEEDCPVGIQRLDLIANSGRLLPLKTRDEIRAALETVDAYVLEILARHSDNLLRIIRTAHPQLVTASLQHVKKVVKWVELPAQVKSTYPLPHPWVDHDSTYEEIAKEDEEQKKRNDTLRYVVTVPASSMSKEDLLELVMSNDPFQQEPDKIPRVTVASLPALIPTTKDQAAQWSLEYWPVTFRNTNPYGPHPSLVSDHEAGMKGMAPLWLDLADIVGGAVHDAQIGEKVGCVIIDSTGPTHNVVAVAGDCRWRSPTGEAVPKQGPGNVMAHSVQRAIAMVAKKRLRAVDRLEPDPMSAVYCDTPVTELETKPYSLDNIPSGGYLCVDLDIYVSHEPCVMCSMAILHSRFRRCVFRQRMPLTGGLTAETGDPKMDKGKGIGAKEPRPAGLGCGMFWRPAELNWKFLAWEWHSEDGGTLEIDDGLQV
jgi:tRNA-specific adenosine deaminase 3